MTDTTARGAGPAERAHHAGGDGPAPALPSVSADSEARSLEFCEPSSYRI